MCLKLNGLADSITADAGNLLPPPVDPEEKQNLRLPGVIISEPEKPPRKPLHKRLA